MLTQFGPRFCSLALTMSVAACVPGVTVNSDSSSGDAGKETGGSTLAGTGGWSGLCGSATGGGTASAGTTNGGGSSSAGGNPGTGGTSAGNAIQLQAGPTIRLGYSGADSSPCKMWRSTDAR
jgi:hypothetical protein